MVRPCKAELWPLCVRCVGGIIITVKLQQRRLTISADCDQAGVESAYAHSEAEQHRARTASHLYYAPRLQAGIGQAGRCACNLEPG